MPTDRPRIPALAGRAVGLLAASAAALGAQPASDRDRDRPVTADERRAVIDGVAREMAGAYQDPDVGARMARALRDGAARWGHTAGASDLADSLTAALRAVSHDKHVQVVFSADPLPSFAGAAGRAPDPALVEARRRAARRANQGVARVERLAGNVGYLKVDAMFDPADAGEVVAGAMAVLANTDALLLDLRDCTGGRPQTVALLASYLVDGEPVHLNSIVMRDDAGGAPRTTPSYTLAWVPGRRYAGKPVWVLTSGRTISAGEELAYDLQALRRATVVGEVTAGAANPGGMARVTPNFAVFVPRGRAVNPVTGTNWEGVGVRPDVAVPSDQALAAAHRLALRHVAATTADPALRQEAEAALTRVAAR